MGRKVCVLSPLPTGCTKPSINATHDIPKKVIQGGKESALSQAKKLTCEVNIKIIKSCLFSLKV